MYIVQSFTALRAEQWKGRDVGRRARGGGCYTEEQMKIGTTSHLERTKPGNHFGRVVKHLRSFQ